MGQFFIERNVITSLESNTALSAFRLLNEHGFSALPVLDEDGEMSSVLSIRDLKVLAYMSRPSFVLRATPFRRHIWRMCRVSCVSREMLTLSSVCHVSQYIIAQEDPNLLTGSVFDLIIYGKEGQLRGETGKVCLFGFNPCIQGCCAIESSP